MRIQKKILYIFLASVPICFFVAWLIVSSIQNAPAPYTNPVSQEETTYTTPSAVTTQPNLPAMTQDNTLANLPIDSQENISKTLDLKTLETKPDSSFRLEIPTKEERSRLPACGTTLFSTFPVNMSNVSSITPIGNLGPPGHTFPTDHPHIHMGARGSGGSFPIYAPADIYITSVAWQKGSTQDPVDYVIYFSPCKDVIAYYNHVKTVSKELQTILDTVSCESFSEGSTDACTKVLLDKVEEGTPLGTVGLQQGNFDFGLIDLRKPLAFVQSERYPERSRYIHCAFDYYDATKKNVFYNLIDRTDGMCGGTMQDVKGTLKGNWFHKSAQSKYVTDWNVGLAFVDHYENPTIQVVSIAGIFTKPSLYEFNPRRSGSINREFSDVRADENIYCYQSESIIRTWETKPSGKILVQMIDDETLQIEHQEGSCSKADTFSNPSVYQR